MIRAEKITSLLIVLFSVYIGIESTKYPLGTIDNPGPGFFPLLLGIAIAVMGIAQAANVWSRASVHPQRTLWAGREGLFKVSIAFTATLLFSALLEITGYLVNVFFLFLILLKPIGRQSWLLSIPISAAAVLISYLLFDRWLMIPLPRGIGFGQ